jgi:hypothetical protein
MKSQNTPKFHPKSLPKSPKKLRLRKGLRTLQIVGSRRTKSQPRWESKKPESEAIVERGTRSERNEELWIACNLDAKLGSCGDKQKNQQEHSALRRKRQEQDRVLTTHGEVWVGKEEKELWAEGEL